MAWLARFIDRVRVRELADGPVHVARLPDGRTNVIYRELADGTSDLTVSGPRSRALFKTKVGIRRMLTVELERGWSLPLLGVPASAFVDRITYLDDIWGSPAHELRDRLRSCTAGTLVEALSSAIVARRPRNAESSSARIARRAVKLLEAELLPIGDLASRLGVTARHLHRAFTEAIGIPPKQFARTVRLHRVLAAMPADWSRLAADAGYYDQAHLIAEFHALVGLTPTAYARIAGLAEV